MSGDFPELAKFAEISIFYEIFEEWIGSNEMRQIEEYLLIFY